MSYEPTTGEMLFSALLGEIVDNCTASVIADNEKAFLHRFTNKTDKFRVLSPSCNIKYARYGTPEHSYVDMTFSNTIECVSEMEGYPASVTSILTNTQMRIAYKGTQMIDALVFANGNSTGSRLKLSSFENFKSNTKYESNIKRNIKLGIMQQMNYMADCGGARIALELQNKLNNEVMVYAVNVNNGAGEPKTVVLKWAYEVRLSGPIDTLQDMMTHSLPEIRKHI